MPYATQNDIVRLNGDRILYIVADRDRNGEIDAGAVAGALDIASSEVDSYLQARYPVPLTNASPMVMQVTIDIAIYRLAFNENAMTDEMQKRYDSAIVWLSKVVKGDVSATATPGTGVVGGVVTGQTGTGAQIIPTVTNGGVVALTIVNPGSGYIPEGTVPLVFTGGGGNGARGTATITDGKVTGVTLTHPGGGYTTLPTVLVGLSGSALDPSMLPPAVTGGKRAGVFYSQNRWSYTKWGSRRRAIP